MEAKVFETPHGPLILEPPSDEAKDWAVRAIQAIEDTKEFIKQIDIEEL